MNFLEARRLLDGFKGGEPLPFAFTLSGTGRGVDATGFSASALDFPRPALASVLH